MNLTIRAFRNYTTVIRTGTEEKLFPEYLTLPYSKWSSLDLPSGKVYLSIKPEDYISYNQIDIDVFDKFIACLYNCYFNENYILSNRMYKAYGRYLSQQNYNFENLFQFNYCPYTTQNSIVGLSSKACKYLCEDFLAYSSLAAEYKNTDFPNFWTIYQFMLSAFKLASQNGMILFITEK